MFKRNVLSALLLVVIFTVLTGLVYPLVVTGVAQLLFPHTANGSLIQQNGKIVGSELIGQPFSDPKYFWGRLSATTPYAYNASSSAGSNYGPLNPALFAVSKKRIEDLKKFEPPNTQPIPVDLVTASGSGLDPHISVASALYQLDRVARYRGMSPQAVRTLVDRSTEGRQLGVLGERRVNVLKLNLALDEQHK